jgi:hypothetical protein
MNMERTSPLLVLKSMTCRGHGGAREGVVGSIRKAARRARETSRAGRGRPPRARRARFLAAAAASGAEISRRGMARSGGPSARRRTSRRAICMATRHPPPPYLPPPRLPHFHCEASPRHADQKSQSSRKYRAGRAPVANAHAAPVVHAAAEPVGLGAAMANGARPTTEPSRPGMTNVARFGGDGGIALADSLSTSACVPPSWAARPSRGGRAAGRTCLAMKSRKVSSPLTASSDLACRAPRGVTGRRARPGAGGLRFVAPARAGSFACRRSRVRLLE